MAALAVAEAPASYDVCRGQDAHHFRIAVPDVLALPDETTDWPGLAGCPTCNRGAIWDTGVVEASQRRTQDPVCRPQTFLEAVRVKNALHGLLLRR